jgi:hypothetical protein
MATTPAFIGNGRFGEWAVRLTTQVSTRAGTPPASSLLATGGAGSSLIESITARAVGANVASQIFLHVFRNSTQQYLYAGSIPLPATSAPAAGADITNGIQSIVLPIILFPAPQSAGTEFRGIRLAANCSLFASLETAVASGWDIYANGGDC